MDDNTEEVIVAATFTDSLSAVPKYVETEPVEDVTYSTMLDLSKYPIFIDAAGFTLKCFTENVGYFQEFGDKTPNSSHYLLFVKYKDGTSEPLGGVQSFNFSLKANESAKVTIEMLDKFLFKKQTK